LQEKEDFTNPKLAGEQSRIFPLLNLARGIFDNSVIGIFRFINGKRRTVQPKQRFGLYWGASKASG
jgi:hypothetical protein